MSEEDYIAVFTPKEVEAGCYDAKIDGIPIYGFIRSLIRIEYLKQNGIKHIVYQKRGPLLYRILSILISFYHLYVSMPQKVKVLFKTFRLESINGIWMDKFYDPIIEECNINSDYVILETNHGRLHKNRIHKNKVFYDDAFAFIAKVRAFLLLAYYTKRKYKREFRVLHDSISKIIPNTIVDANKKKYYREIISCILRTIEYKKYLKKRGVSCVFAASRSGFLPLLCACKSNGVSIYELQHGIGYGEDVTYGGYRDFFFTPNKFLLFGNIYPRNVYGIDETSIIIIGWALKNYVKKQISNTSISDSDILILSQPNLTNYVIEAVLKMADNYRDRSFYIRFHPMEKISDNILSRLNIYSNIFIQDNSISLIIGLQPFKHVMGVQSTAVYEALSYGKKVGIIALNGYNPIFLQDSDEQNFWVVRDKASFNTFLQGKVTDKKAGGIYSTFDVSQFKRLIL